jgi:hypothetical protein
MLRQMGSRTKGGGMREREREKPNHTELETDVGVEFGLDEYYFRTVVTIRGY